MQTKPYTETAPTRDQVDATRGWLLLDFGTDWCGHCMAARTAVDAWLASHPEVTHVRVEDGRGRPLGRSFRVKLWPTLVLLRDGVEAAQVVRPREPRDLWALDAAIPPQR